MRVIIFKRVKRKFLSKIHFKLRFVLIFAFTILISVAAVTRVFLKLYNLSKSNISTKWRDTTLKVANEMDYYLKMPKDAVAFTAVALNGMLHDKRPNEEVLEFLIKQTEIYATIIDENNTGVYAYFNGEYLDGSQWEAPDGYEPKLRPWYKSALDARGEIAFSQPYYNMQTFTMMMSVSQLLDDRDSVVSMDVFLDTVQRMVQKNAKEGKSSEIFVMADNGFAVAHSEQKKIAMNLGLEGSAVEREIVKRLQNGESGDFTVKCDYQKYSVFTQPVNDDWTTVVVFNDAKIYRSIYLLYFTFGFVLLVMVCAIVLTFIYMNRKYAESEHLNREIEAVADIYVAVVRVNLVTDEMHIVRSSKNLETVLAGSTKNYSNRIQNFAEAITSEGYAPLVRDFMDPFTLEKRLKKVKSVSLEYIDMQGKWMRLRYFEIDRTETGRLYHVMVAFEYIDEDKRQQEALKKLSETDLMTGVQNRGSGEQKIRSALKNGRKGMFCLIDVDKFKSINDGYGHQIGDEALKSIADCLKAVFRESDIVFRLGGDEFAAFADGVTEQEIGVKILDRLVERMNKINIPALKDRQVTVSIGVSFFPNYELDCFEAVYQRADEGTYESKKHDGNFYSFV